MSENTNYTTQGYSPNPTMQQYASQPSTNNNVFTVLALAWIAHVLLDIIIFQFVWSWPRMVAYGILTIVLISLLDSQKLLGSVILLTVTFLVYNVFIQYTSEMLFGLSFVGGANSFIFSEWISKIIVLLFPVLIFLFLYKKVFHQRLNVHYPALVLFFYTAYLLPVIADLLRTDVIANFLGEAGGFTAGVVFQTLTIQLLLFVIPAWSWYLNSLQTDSKVMKFSRGLQVLLLICIMVVILISNVIHANSEVETSGFTENPLVVAGSFFTEGWQVTVDSVRTATQTAQNQTMRALDFEGDVERGAVRDVGLSLEPLQRSQQRFVQGQEVAFFTTLQVRSFSTDIPVTLQCQATSGSSQSLRIDGRLDRPQFMARDFVNQDVTCRFPFLPGNQQYTVSVNATFDYVTSAFLRRYFVREGLLEQFRGTSVSPSTAFFNQYQISDRNPVSVYTQGPVSLHLTTPNIVEEIEQSTGSRTRFRLQIGIKNEPRWQGQIHAVNNVLLSIPFGFQILQGGSSATQGFSCTTGGLQSNITFLTNDQCLAMNQPFSDLDCQNYYHFLFTPVNRAAAESIQVPQAQSRVQELVLSCEIEALNPNEILGGSAFSIDSFRARVAYSYQTSQSSTFRVEASESNTLSLADIASLSRLQYCGFVNAYNIEPNFGLVFGYNPGLNDTFFEKQDQLRASLTESNQETLNQPNNCFERHILWGYAYQFWDQIRFGSVGQTFFGPMRVTQDMLRVVSNNDPSFIQPTQENRDEVVAYLEEHNLKVAFAYLSLMRDRCQTDSQNNQLLAGGGDAKNDLVCAVGKYACGSNFVYGNYNSCTTTDCTFCHRVLIPNIITIATQSDFYER